MLVERYNELVRACFANPEHAGELKGGYDAACTTDVSESESGARLLLAVGVRNSAIAEMRFLAWGCPYLIAAAETLCTDKENTPVATLPLFDQNELKRRLSVPDTRIGRILLLEDALSSLAAQLNANEEQD